MYSAQQNQNISKSNYMLGDLSTVTMVTTVTSYHGKSNKGN